MSRFDGLSDADWDGTPPEFWDHNVKLALSGKRGKQALRDLRDALLALPEKRLIANALCSVGIQAKIAAEPVYVHPGRADAVDWRNWHRDSLQRLFEQQGEGVCAVGAYIWWQKVKKGADPQAAFAEMPTMAEDGDEEPWATALAGKRAGLTYTLAWELGQMNDVRYRFDTPEERYDRFMAWIEEQLAA